jgi:hypothetical protein
VEALHAIAAASSSGYGTWLETKVEILTSASF